MSPHVPRLRERVDAGGAERTSARRTDLAPYAPPGAETLDAPTAHESRLDPRRRLTGIETIWRTHWTRARENMLDWPHLAFVHRRSIGKDLAPFTEESMDTLLEAHDSGWRVHAAIFAAFCNRANRRIADHDDSLGASHLVARRADSHRTPLRTVVIASRGSVGCR